MTGGGTCDQGIGRPRGGLTTRIVAVTDALGYLVHFVILPGQAHDLKGTEAVLQDLDGDALIADTAFDADSLLADLESRGITAALPARRNRSVIREHDRDMYAWRHQIENFFAKIKEFRGIAMRFDKTLTSFAAFIYLVAGVIAAR